MNLGKLHTIKQFCERFPWMTEGALRRQIFDEEMNGLSESGAIVRLGSKILINEDRYAEWLESKQKRAA